MQGRRLKSMRVGTLGAVLLATALLAVLAPSASAVVVHQPDGHFLGITPARGVSPASIPGSVAAQHAATRFSTNGNLDYNGGPVLHSSAPYLIFWTPSGESISGSTQFLLARYFSDVAADSGKANDVYGVDRQFTDGSGFADYKQIFSSGSQARTDTQPYPTSGNCPKGSNSACLTDAQLQSEVQRLISANGLPTGTGANAPIYFVVTPTDVDVCEDGTGTSCAHNVFCAYHGTFNNGSDVLYSSIPLLPASQFPKGCQSDNNGAVQTPNGDQVADVAIKYLSHEDSETITDPLLNAWFDDLSGNEDGDNCNFSGSFAPQAGFNPNAFTPTLGGNASAGTLYNQLINGNQYYIQSEWSNGDVNCELRPSFGVVGPAFSVSAAGLSPGFDPGVSAHSNAITSATWSFGDGSAQTFNAGGSDSALAPVFHGFPGPGTYPVTLTLVDDRGNLQTATDPVTVGMAPIAAFGVSPGRPAKNTAVNFDGSASREPDTGVALTSYAWNFGDGTTGVGITSRHTYKKAGTYSVTLTVGDSAGSTASTTHALVVVRGSTITKVVVRSNKKGKFLFVTVDGPGRLTIGSHHFNLKRGKTVKVKVVLTKGQRIRLARASTLKIKIPIKFRPALGAPVTVRKTVKFGR